jgi:membrane protein implicated in regulation of membrane protease activity
VSRGRFPLSTLMAVIGGVVLIVSGQVLWAIVFFAIAAAFAVMTLRRAR